MLGVTKVSAITLSEIKQIITETGQGLKRLTTGSIKANFSQQYYHVGYIMESPLNLRMGFTRLNPDVIRASVLNPLDAIKWPESKLTLSISL